MKFNFKGISSYEEQDETNYVGAIPKSVILEFDNIQVAIDFIEKQHGFIISPDHKLAFRVLEITEAD